MGQSFNHFGLLFSRFKMWMIIPHLIIKCACFYKKVNLGPGSFPIHGSGSSRSPGGEVGQAESEKPSWPQKLTEQTGVWLRKRLLDISGQPSCPSADWDPPWKGTFGRVFSRDTLSQISGMIREAFLPLLVPRPQCLSSSPWRC